LAYLAMNAPTPPRIKLADREQRLLQLISEGWPKTYIAESFGVEVGTLERYRGRLYKKLGVRTLPGAVYRGFEEGLLTDSGAPLPDGALSEISQSVLRLIVLDKKDHEIAEELGMHTNSVARIARRTAKQLGAVSRPHLARNAVERGDTPVDSLGLENRRRLLERSAVAFTLVKLIRVQDTTVAEGSAGEDSKGKVISRLVETLNLFEARVFS